MRSGVVSLFLVLRIIYRITLYLAMESIKKKLSQLKDEKENALEAAEDAVTAQKEAERRADEVSAFCT